MTLPKAMRQSTQTTARRCIFCQKQANSREHVFPTWLNEVLSQLPFEAAAGETPQWSRGQRDFRSGETAEQAWGAAEIASVRTRWVCHRCNTGWMSHLEGRSRQLLEPMILGRAHFLTLDQQIIVATWATKTAMVAERTVASDERDVFPQDQCRIVMEQDRPPGLLRVRVAALEGSIPPLRYSCTRSQIQRNGVDFFKAHTYTLQINTLVLAVLRGDPPPPSYSALKELAVPDDIEVPVFPPVDEFFWPPKQSLTPESWAQYVTRSTNPPPLPGP